MPRTEDYVTGLRERLADPELSAEYLKACLEDPDPRVFLLALRDVAEANGGFMAVSRRAKLNRESLDRALSKEGNLSVKSLIAILDAVGLKLSIGLADTVNLANRNEQLELRSRCSAKRLHRAWTR
jgi:probable addiction module antidote protein